jgi:membrane protease YdiL (CAAX protease family)
MITDGPSESLPSAGPPPLPVIRRAAWWAWPLIVFCLLPFEWIAGKLVPGPAKASAPAAETGRADLALVKLQSQVVIASSRFDPTAPREALEDLSDSIQGDDAFVALALLEGFVEPGSAGALKTLERVSDEAPAELVELAGRALRDGVGEEDRDRLREHLGWFAGLARGPGLVPPPEDASIRSRSYLVLATMGMVVTGVVFGLLCGAVLLILHLRRVGSGAPANAFRAETRNGGVFLECFALYLGIMVGGAIAGIWLGEVASIGGYAAAVLVPLVWPLARGMRWREFRLEAGLHRGQGWLREVAAGVVGYLGVLAIASIGVFFTLVLTFLAGWVGGETAGTEGATAPGPEVHPIVGWLYEGDLWTRLACFALAAGFAPLFEELFFRGALQRYLRGRFRFLPSALLGALIFAALHPQGVFAIPALAGIAVGFSLLREWRDSLIAPMTAHAINNGCLVGMLWWAL